jgi:hypothetical protein
MVDERSRLQLADAAKQVLGDDAGITLMELLPPVGWADVATKHDLLALEDRLVARFESRFGGIDSRLGENDFRFAAIGLRFDAVDARFDAVDARFDAVDARFVRLEDRMDGLDGRMERLAAEVRAQTWKLMTLMVAVVGVVVAAVRL